MAQVAQQRPPLLLRAVASYPWLWGIGLGAAFWPVMAVIGLPAVFRARMDRIALAATAVTVTLLLSCGVGIAAGFGSAGRIIGAAANISVWVGLIALLVTHHSADEAMRRLFVRSCVVVGSVNSVVALVALVAYPRVLPIPLLGGIADRLPSGVGNFTSRELIDDSWLNGPVLRTVGMMAQPTWSGAVSVLTILLTMWLFRGLSRRAQLLATVATVLNLVNVYYSYGRATQAGLAVALFYVGARLVWQRWRLGPALISVATGAVVVLVVLNFSELLGQLVEVNDAREGSADARGDIYAATLSLISDLQLPVVGYGLKPAEEGLVASVATHSTYLGLLFRGGIIGALAFLVLLGLCAQRCLRADSGIPAASVLFIAIWCIFEDFDPGHLVPLFLAASIYAAGAAPPTKADHGEQSDRHEKGASRLIT